MVPSSRFIWAASLASLAFLVACGGDEARGPDVHPDAEQQVGFGRGCNTDEQCESNACVPHIGNTVCSQVCSPDAPCPDNWTCWTPAGATNFEGSFCVSPHWSLCRPCSADADCSSISQDEPGACINYNDSGTFCGSDCTTSAECPEGYSCADAQTRSGRQVRQCVNDSGMCECNSYIAGLGENTRCATENEWGRCQGERGCDTKLWSRCDAETPAPDAPNQRDDDCDGLTDENDCLCGDSVCDGNCGETLANCPCDCAAEGDGVCSPCGENPGTSPGDCCRGPGGTTGCGDGFCMGFGCQENPATCPQDCSTPCGNLICEPGENPFNCAEDCKHQVCGNHVCEASDGGPEACPQDCDAYCGDCACDPQRDESVFNCAIDCGYCGDGSCSPCSLLNENPTTCAEDCCVPRSEICNGIDDDCDGDTDEADAAGCDIYYRDADDDGLGHWDDARCLCAPLNAWSARGLGDCDDDDANVGAGDAESCNDADDDCDGETDEDFDLGTPCTAPGGNCFAGGTACDGPDRTHCVDIEPLDKGTVCHALRCLGGVIQPPSICDGAGKCTDLPVGNCGGYLCDDAGRCTSDCETDEDCAEGFGCGVTGECELSGEPCTTDVACIDQDWTTTDYCILVCSHGERTGEPPTGDIDGDGVINSVDLCPETIDPDQRDRDNDGRGDACDRCEGEGAPEVCNDRDDDCDGETDEGMGVGVSCVADGDPCSVGVRICGVGTTVCPGISPAAAGVQCLRGACVGDDLRLASRCDGEGGCLEGPVVPCHGFLCEEITDGAQCTTACVADADCAAGHHCATSPTGGLCAPDLANGQECGNDRQCASGMCVDGVCCASDCTGGCFTCAAPGALGECRPVAANSDPKDACGACGTCNAVGACTNVPAGPSPKDACPVEAPCGGVGLCNASGQCRVAAAGTACNTATCSNGELSAGTTCDGQGECRDSTNSACPGELLCASATACLSRCTTDRDCRAGNYCEANGTCTDLKAKGQTCTLDRQCTTGICADGVCCDGRCGGDCQSCAIVDKLGTCSPYTSGADPESECGICGACNGSSACGPAAAGTDPNDDCDVVTPCGTTGACNGDFGCTVTASGVPCGTSTCVGSTLVTARQCDGAGTCSSPTLTPCVGFVCDEAGVACRTGCTNDNHCQTGNFCEANQCKPKLVAGSTCGRPGACQSGFCTDGVCCGTACSEICNSCNVSPQTRGTCTALVDGTSDGICSGELTCKQGACKALDGAYCNGPTDCAHGNCVDNVCCSSACTGPCMQCRTGACLEEPAGAADPFCDGGKACNGPAAGVCGVVNGRACNTSSECVSGNCDNNICCGVACLGACETCSLDGTSCVDVTGGAADSDTCVAPRGCFGGECRRGLGESCTAATQCASGFCSDATIAAGDVNVCCEEACNGPCQNCNGVTGKCDDIVLQDEPACIGTANWCDADGNCTAEEGSPCDDSDECQVGFYCDTDEGECRAEQQLGDSCSADEECDSGFCANHTSGGSTSGDSGVCCIAPCNGACDTCDDDGFCDVDLMNEPGACEDGYVCDGSGHCLLKKGAPCNDNPDCASNACVQATDGPFKVCCQNDCDGLCEGCTSVGECKPITSGPDVDTSCDSPFECAGLNQCLLKAGQACGIDDSCATGICEDDMCCTASCAAGFHCAAGNCTADRPLGPGCSVDADCTSGYCINGSCCAQSCGAQPDRRCAICTAGSNYALCNPVTSGATPDCDGTCNSSGRCDLSDIGVHSTPSTPVPE